MCPVPKAMVTCLQASKDCAIDQQFLWSSEALILTSDEWWAGCMWARPIMQQPSIYTQYMKLHRRRINTEEKAKVVASVSGGRIYSILAALAVLHWTNWITGWIAPGWFERKGWIHYILKRVSLQYIIYWPCSWSIVDQNAESSKYRIIFSILLYLVLGNFVK